MVRARVLVSVVVVAAACGGGSSQHDAAVPLDASADLDAGADADLDAGVDADLEGYIEQPPVEIPPAPPPLDVSGQPVDDQGRPILMQGVDYHLVARPPDALTALSDCTDMIVRCFDPGAAGHNFDACATSTPRCATAQPWLEAAPCCATTCVDRYVQLRTGRTPPIAAFREAFYGEPSCAPGVDALLGGAP